MNKEQAQEYAKDMTYMEAVNNAMRGRSIPYRKATMIKLHELLKHAESLDQVSNESVDSSTESSTGSSTDCISREAVIGIRSEIEQLPITDTAIKLVAEILDKYKSESEDKEDEKDFVCTYQETGCGSCKHQTNCPL